jgi:hypothetical protein
LEEDRDGGGGLERERRLGLEDCWCCCLKEKEGDRRMEGDGDVERQEHTIARYRLLRRRGKRMRRGVIVPIEVSGFGPEMDLATVREERELGQVAKWAAG